MKIVEDCEIFRGMGSDAVSRVVAITRTESLPAGEQLFVLGQRADHLYVVLEGRLDLCMPVAVVGTMKEVTVDTKEAGSAVGWSAFVKPHRFRHTARAAEPCRLAVLARDEFTRLLDADPALGRRFMERIAETIAERLLTVQALWARELQRSISQADGRGHGACVACSSAEER